MWLINSLRILFELFLFIISKNQNSSERFRSLKISSVILCLLYNSYNVSSENFVLDQLIGSTNSEESSGLFLYPLTSKNDELLISPYNFTPESNIKVTQLQDMILKLRSSRF